jgi:hypothetical protein
VSVRQELQGIYDQFGALTPRLVVDQARPEDHPLHSRFTWADAEAGEAYRRVEAARLIRSVKVVYRQGTDRDGPRRVRGYHAVRDETGSVYRPADVICGDPFMRELVLRDMEREWKQLRRRYSRFEEFAQMVRRDLDADAAA